VNNKLEPIFKAIPNVQTVDIRGAADREFHVEPIPERLIGANATLGDVFAAVAANNANLPGGILRQHTPTRSIATWSRRRSRISRSASHLRRARAQHQRRRDHVHQNCARFHQEDSGPISRGDAERDRRAGRLHPDVTQ
jgi:multidrug efflux pump subunit AcrB